jgi:Tfp pilus assembly protein PilF
MNRRFVNAVMVLLLVAVAGCASSKEREADMEKKNNRSETHVMLGANYLQRGQLDVAKEELDKALKEAPDNSQATTSWPCCNGS